MSTTLTDVRRAFDALRKAWTDAGIVRTGPSGTGAPGLVTLTGADLVLEEGSQTYGHSWRLYYRHPVTGGHYMAAVDLLDGHLGWTRAEAERSLRALAAGIRAATRS